MNKFILLSILFLLSCKQDPKYDSDTSGISLIKHHSIQMNDNYDRYVSVIHDDNRNVTCWITYHGISCLPDTQLNINKKEDKK